MRTFWRLGQLCRTAILRQKIFISRWGLDSHRAFILWPAYAIFRQLAVRDVSRRCIPRRHRMAFFLFRHTLRALQTANVPHWIYGGTMLGAVRSSNFAGRPGDIDLLIPREFSSVAVRAIRGQLESMPGPSRAFFRLGVARVQIWQKPSCDSKWYLRLVIGSVGTTVIEIAAADFSDATRLGVVVVPSTWSRPQRSLRLPAADFLNPEETFVYGLSVKTLRTPERYLEAMYGAEWRVPARRIRANSEKRGRYSDPVAMEILA
jgi:hypothetical protein